MTPPYPPPELPFPLPTYHHLSPLELSQHPPPPEPHSLTSSGEESSPLPLGAETPGSGLCPSCAIADPSDLSWEEDEEEEEGPEEEEEEEDDDDDDDDDDIDVSLEKETPVKQVKRLAPQKQTSAAKVREEHHPPPWARPPELSALRPGPDLPGAQREPALAPSLTHTPHNACVWFLEEKGGKRRGSEVTVNLAKTFKLVEVLST